MERLRSLRPTLRRMGRMYIDKIDKAVKACGSLRARISFMKSQPESNWGWGGGGAAASASAATEVWEWEMAKGSRWES